MENKKLGIVLVGISSVLALLLVQLIGGMSTEAKALGCFENAACSKLQSGLSLTHFAFGFIGFMLALGFYLLFFSPSEEALLRRIEESKRKELGEEKFSLVMKGLDISEQEVIKAVREQDGITQSTLRLRTAMSKAKLSTVLSDLEKKGLIARQEQGKTLSVHIKEAF